MLTFPGTFQFQLQVHQNVQGRMECGLDFCGARKTGEFNFGTRRTNKKVTPMMEQQSQSHCVTYGCKLLTNQIGGLKGLRPGLQTSYSTACVLCYLIKHLIKHKINMTTCMFVQYKIAFFKVTTNCTCASTSIFLYSSSSSNGFTERNKPLQVSVRAGTGNLGRLF